jgi:Spy/CpxP family protein refolding chaperone
MIKKITILTLLLASTNLIDAHCGGCGVGDKEGHGQNKKQHHKHIDELKLSSDQKETYDAITQKYRNEMKSLEENYRLEINSMLNNDQREIYKNHSKESSKLCNLK